MRNWTRTVLAASAVAAASVLAAACSGDAGSTVNYYDVRLEADAPSVAECHEAVAIRFEPVKLDPQPADSLYQTATYTDQPVITGKPASDGPGNWECRFTYRSRDLAPGTWHIVGEFSNGPRSCEREIRPGLANRLAIDQADGCVDLEKDKA
jgi:hypothetical protein